MQRVTLYGPWSMYFPKAEISRKNGYKYEGVHCLGNLSLSGYNSKLPNHSFSRKQAKASATSLGRKIEVGYKNDLALNNLEFELEGQNIVPLTSRLIR